MNKDYMEIIDLPHHSSKKHRRMDPMDRAAQFAPFAALTGYDDAVLEAGRQTVQFIEIDEDKKNQINEKIKNALQQTEAKISVVYFLSDPVKSGGCYERTEGVLRRVDEVSRSLIFADGTSVPIDSIYDIDGPV